MSTQCKRLLKLSIVAILLLFSCSYAAENDFYTETRKIDIRQVDAELYQLFPELKQKVEEQKKAAAEKAKKDEEQKPAETKKELSPEEIKKQAEKEKKAAEKTLNIIWANLESPTLSVETAYANGGIGAVDTLDKIVQSQKQNNGKIVAAINAGYFEIGGDRQTYGTYFNNGEVVHIGDIGSLATFDSKNKFSMQPLFTTIEGAINGQWQKPNNFKAWNINHFMDNNDALLIFDSFYQGVQPAHNYTTITVVNHHVSRIETGTFNIPTNGFLILVKDSKIINKFKIGDKVEYKFKHYYNNYSDNVTDGSQLYLNKVKNAIGAGPILLKDGKIVADPVKEKFFEDKINFNRAKRSFIGKTDYNMFAMVTIDEVTMLEAAYIAKSLGLVDAINLDGGGSSSLYYNDNYLKESKRKIANALVIKTHDKAASHLFVNDREIFSNDREIVKQMNEQTYVLASELAKGLEARFSYSPLSGLAEIYRYQKRYTINTEKETISDGKDSVKLRTLPANNKYDVYINIDDFKKIMPLESIYTDYQKTLRIHIKTLSSTLSSANYLANTGKYNSAAELYKKALAMDYKNITTLSALGDIYLNKLNDTEQAIKYYSLALQYSPDDAYIINAKAKALGKRK